MGSKRKEIINHWQRMKENHPENFSQLHKKEYRISHIEWWTLPEKSMAITNSSIYHLLKNFDYDTVHPNKMTHREWIYEHIEICAGTAEYIKELMWKYWSVMNHNKITQMQQYYLQDIYKNLLEIKHHYDFELNVRSKYLQHYPNKNPYIPKQRINNWEIKHASNLDEIKKIAKELEKLLNSNQEEWY